MDIDDTDRAILWLLQQNARTSNAAIGRRLGLSASVIFDRIRRLEQNGVVERHECVLGPRAAGAGMVAWIMVQACEADGAGTGELLSAVPGGVAVYRAIGDSCFIVKVRVRDTDALARILDDGIAVIPAITSTDTRIVVKTTKETTRLPLPAPPDTPAR
jgi:Lrp/AsnC family leucine-responsive transcriptional regulator